MSKREEQEALIEGERAGMLDVPAGANPHDLHTAKYDAWERGRRNIALRRVLLEELRKRARTASCRYVAGATCNCGGRGFCLDVA